MTDATTAAKAIQARHHTVMAYDAEADDNVEVCAWDHGEGPCFDLEDAGIVLVQINKVIAHLEEIRNTLQRHSGDGSNSNYNHAVAALACLRSDDS